MMFGYNKSYSELLAESGLETLSDRRTKALKKFAEKCVKNDMYSDLFPLNEVEVNTRDKKKYKEIFARSDRLYKSPVFTMRRLLNNTPDIDKTNNPHLVDLSHMFNDPFSI